MPSPFSMRVTSSVRIGAPPGPGIERRRWHWHDLLHRPAPGKGTASEASYTERHGTDGMDDSEARVGFATHFRMRVEEDGDESVLVDELVTVELRFLSGVLAAENAISRRVADGSRRGLRRVTTSTARVSARVGGRGGVAIQKSTSFTVMLIEWFGRTLRDTLHALLEAPDRLWAGATSSGAHLKQKRERRALLLGLADPHALSREGKAAALFVAGSGILASALLVTLAVGVFAPEHLFALWTAINYFGTGVLGVLVFPFFPEFRFASIAAVIGAPLAILSIALGMTVGGWLVLFLGDSIHTALRKGLRPDSAMARGLTWAERFAGRHGFWAAFLVLCIPLGPDTPTFYVLASVRTPARQLLLGAFLGIVVRFVIWGAATRAF